MQLLRESAFPQTSTKRSRLRDAFVLEGEGGDDLHSFGNLLRSVESLLAAEFTE